ncbi:MULTISPECIES: hypothetical protein [unclassified Rathayibacter]|uniref:hypothetical protein n=1 Tax=unclassified Rathayibacter TaxID=2609250 RepID=UPI001048C38C|nr:MULTISPECIES: hypothetical protein [unclassified Rathayibacter]TCL85880.1 hypothetical protein EDF49_101549 [Rathayibacter sp. PhB192]TCM31701.1 hypothetical protein EDF43_101549 [Rathayibacter sp. PhB179]
MLRTSGFRARRGAAGWQWDAVLGGYLTAKCAALAARAAPKDAYDLMFVLLYNPGGAREAARAIAGIPVVSHRRPPAAVARAAVSMLLDPQGPWAGHFATQMQEAGDEEPEERLRADAAAGASLLLRTLDQNA